MKETEKVYHDLLASPSPTEATVLEAWKDYSAAYDDAQYLHEQLAYAQADADLVCDNEASLPYGGL